MEPGDVSVPRGIACATCGENVERGYAPVDGDEVVASETVCSTCGWTEVGVDGNAPGLADFEGRYDALVRLGPGEDGPEVETVAEES